MSDDEEKLGEREVIQLLLIRRNVEKFRRAMIQALHDPDTGLNSDLLAERTDAALTAITKGEPASNALSGWVLVGLFATFAMSAKKDGLTAEVYISGIASLTGTMLDDIASDAEGSDDDTAG